MICKNCGNETSTVICEKCGVNVVWFNKYGDLHDEYNPGELELYSRLLAENSNQYDHSSIEDIAEELFIPDGSGD